METFFNFDPEFESQPWSVTTNGEDLGNLCNHRREIIALAAFHNSQTNVVEKQTGLLFISIIVLVIINI